MTLTSDMEPPKRRPRSDKGVKRPRKAKAREAALAFDPPTSLPRSHPKNEKPKDHLTQPVTGLLPTKVTSELTPSPALASFFSAFETSTEAKPPSKTFTLGPTSVGDELWLALVHLTNAGALVTRAVWRWANSELAKRSAK
jgi:hypothetical protein